LPHSQVRRSGWPADQAALAGSTEVRGDDIAGLAVTIAKRLCDLAAPGRVLIRETVRINMLNAGVTFEDQGEHKLKGVPGSWQLHALKV